MEIFSSKLVREDPRNITILFPQEKLAVLHKLLLAFAPYFLGKLEFSYDDYLFYGSYTFDTKELADVFCILFGMEMKSENK